MPWLWDSTVKAARAGSRRSSFARESAEQPVAVGLEELAAVHEVGHRYGIGVRGVGAAVVVEHQRPGAEAEFPQGLFCGARRARAERCQHHERRGRRDPLEEAPPPGPWA